MKPVLVGMNNPHGADPKFALYPAPVGSAGHRLYVLLRDRRPDVLRGHYVTAFRRVNLVRGPAWCREQARAAVTDLRPDLEGRTVVLLGEEVRRAFGLPQLLIHPQVQDGAAYRQLPHPSGRNLWYNDPTNRMLAGMLLEELYEGH